MDDIKDLSILIKDVAYSACRTFCDAQDKFRQDYEYSKVVPREMKATMDQILEEKILERLVPIGLPILSEEKGEIEGRHDSDLRFVVDPLDGTVNFARDLGPASISIALCRGNDPVFGSIGIYPTGDLAWGGKNVGAFLNDRAIKVSDITESEKSVLCTGFPARFQFDDIEGSKRYMSNMSHYGKVRMLGAASISLLKVAQGSAELYVEKDIMLWDVAAGLAIVEGAQGVVSVEPGRSNHALNVVASNGVISFP